LAQADLAQACGPKFVMGNCRCQEIYHVGDGQKIGHSVSAVAVLPECVDNPAAEQPPPVSGRLACPSDRTHADNGSVEPCVETDPGSAFAADMKNQPEIHICPAKATAASEAVAAAAAAAAAASLAASGEPDKQLVRRGRRRGSHAADVAAGPKTRRSRGKSVEYGPTTSLADAHTCVIELQSSTIERLTTLGRQAYVNELLDASDPSLVRQKVENQHASSQVQLIDLRSRADTQLSPGRIDPHCPDGLLEGAFSGHASLAKFDNAATPSTTWSLSPRLSPLKNILVNPLEDSGSSTGSSVGYSTTGCSQGRRFPFEAAGDALDSIAWFRVRQMHQWSEGSDECANLRLEPEEPCRMEVDEQDVPFAAVWMTAAEKQQQRQVLKQQVHCKRQQVVVDAEVKRPAKTVIAHVLCRLVLLMCSRPCLGRWHCTTA